MRTAINYQNKTTKSHRKGAKNACTSVNGHMLSFLTREGTLTVRLPAREREAFLEKYNTKLCAQYGTLMKEYVDVPDALLRKTVDREKFFDMRHAYLSSFKPKPTTRKK